MYKTLRDVVTESGIWDGTQKDSHSFLLSPSVYRISQDQQKELNLLGYALNDCLLGLAQIASIVDSTQVNFGTAWTTIRRVMQTGVPSVYRELQGTHARHIPRLLKLDLMVNELGEFKIAEIDGHNKHGVGYSTLGLRFRSAIMPKANALPGVARLLAEETKRQGHTELKLLYADQERFYIPEFKVAQQELLKHDILCSVVSEMDASSEYISGGLFLDLPFMYHRTDLYDTLVAGYKEGNTGFIIPPKPFLGAKGVLALLRNDGMDEQLESIFLAFIKKDSLFRVRGYIPETYLVGKQGCQHDVVLKKTSEKKYVLKESISSGMKGTVFSDGNDFDSTLKKACETNLNWILQEEVSNQAQEFSWFENGIKAAELKTASDWFMRVTVQYVNRNLADIIVTARRDKAVHGAKDCIQIGTIIE